MNEIELDLLKKINSRLEILIYFLLRKNEIEEMTLGQQFRLLKRLGFGDTEIAELFGKSRGYVSSELVRLKKGDKLGRL